jgi:hypothetical protein
MELRLIPRDPNKIAKIRMAIMREKDINNP